ncbi:MAG: DUF975 family protein [Oscillospiraceae bacterium]|nr:DUF975 family protein [Oscillospiraceae bacterium]MBQ7130214.1 DUF975 family protein [Oscillospiraceae bacterium]
MTIPSFKILKKNAAERVAAAENEKKIVLIYAVSIALLALIVTAVNYLLELQIGETGGLSNMGLRTVLSTFQSVIPIIQNFIAMCLNVGFLAAMLRISRRQYASEKTLKLGFDRFWVLLRASLFQGCMYMMAGMAASWLAVLVYMLTPLSNSLQQLLEPMVSDPSFDVAALETMTLSDEVIFSMIPLFILFGILYLAFMIPISYNLRMVNYIIIDKPGMGAMLAIGQSRAIMRGHRMRLFKLDLSLWWWYAISVFSSFLAYGDMLLISAGITLPWSESVSYFLFYILYLVVQFSACWFFRSRVEVVYAQVYDALKPREKQEGVVLGNIFQM